MRPFRHVDFGGARIWSSLVWARGYGMFKWLGRRRETTRRVAGDTDRIVARSADWSEPPSDPDPIAEFVRIVGEAHAVDPADSRSA